MKLRKEITGFLKILTFATVGITSISLVKNLAEKGTEKVCTEYEPVIMTYQMPRHMYDVPEGDTSFKSYMDYRCITNTDSAQYRLQQQCYTDADGLRRTESGDYTIALGSYYASRIGDRYRIELDGGRVFYATVGDFKADCHTDALNQYTEAGNGSKNVVEFIVDTDDLSAYTREMGDISYSDFYGNIESIERIEE